MNPPRPTNPSIVDVARAASVAGVFGLLAVLAYFLQSPDYPASRLYLFVLIGAIGVLGAVGIVFGRPTVIGGSGLGIFLLGFWQAVLGVFMLPVAAVLFLTALLVNVDDATGREALTANRGRKY